MVELIGLGLLILAVPVAVVLGVVGFFIALGLQRRTLVAEQRLAMLERYVSGLARPLPGEVPLAAGPAAPPIVPEVAPAPEPALPAEAAPEPGSAEVPPIAPVPSPVPPVAAPPLPAAPGLEERLGSRWAVWVGGVALALGGVFLVRYSLEQGLLGPGARVAAGGLFAAALIAAGEWLRRRDPGEGGPAPVPAVLAAAGTSTAFATVYAAHALYDLIPAGPALVLLGAVALATMAASALHGPALAALGLVGALGAPLLVRSAEPSPWPLVAYTAVVVAAAYATARLRLWRPLAHAAAAGALLWGLALLSESGDVLPLMAHVVLQAGLAAFFLGAEPYRGVPDAESAPDTALAAILFGFAALGILVAAEPGAGALRPGFAGVLCLVLALTGWRVPAAAAALAAAALAALGTLWVWPVLAEAAAEPSQVLPDPFGTASPRPEAERSFLTFGATSLGLVAALALERVRRGASLPLPTAAWYLGAATVGPLAGLVVAYWRVAWWEPSGTFAAAAGLLAGAYAAAAAWLRRHESDQLDAVRLGTGAAASAAIATLAAGLTFVLDRGLLTLALALAALGTAWVSERARVPLLRTVVGAIGIAVLARLAYDPSVVGGDPGSTPVFNWLLVGYGGPALAFYLAARVLERGGRDRVVRLVESLSLAFAAFLVFFEIRHAVLQGDLYASTTGHLEAGLYAVAALAFSLVLVRAEARRPDVVTRVGALVFGAIALAVSGLGLLLYANPLLTGEPVPGGAVLNSLLAAYLLPACLAGGLAWTARRGRPIWYVRAALWLALVLQALYTGLAIRRAFQGPVIDLFRRTSQAELWTYSAALLLIGVALLAAGLLRGSRALRLASAVYVVAAVAKVFIVDLASLEGVARALSFIGLGLALIGIGLAYQRWLAAAPSRLAKPGAGAP